MNFFPLGSLLKQNEHPERRDPSVQHDRGELARVVAGGAEGPLV